MIDFTVDLLKAVNADLNDWSNDLDKLMNQIFATCESVIKSFQNEINYCNEQLKQITSELNAANKAIQINNQSEIYYKNEIKSLKEQNASLKSQISSLQSQLSATEDSSQKSSINSEISSLKSQISSNNAKISEFERKISQIHTNNEKLYSIMSALRTEESNVKTHLSKLKAKKYSFSDSYHYFRTNVCENINKHVGSLLKNMKEVVFRGESAATSVASLAEGEYGSAGYGSRICVSDSGCFHSASSDIKTQLDNLSSTILSCRTKTRDFTSKLKDRVSANASKAVNSVANSLRSESDDYFTSMVYKLEQAGNACAAYEAMASIL